jgi:site-specific DNA-methyltransferase (adenine-specific)
MNRVVFSKQKKPVWPTPKAVWEDLNREFNFTLDPCAVDSFWDGRLISWEGHRVYCNPPYSGIGEWLTKAPEAELAVYLLPSRTGTKWFHDYCLAANEIRFLRGRLKFGESQNSAPFDSMVVIFK